MCRLRAAYPYFWGGQRYCWYDDAWNGPGWYWCIRLATGLRLGRPLWLESLGVERLARMARLGRRLAPSRAAAGAADPWRSARRLALKRE